MPQAPKPLGLVLCDRLHVDPQAGQMSLVGLFNSLRFRSFPARLPRLTVFAALHGGDGQGTMKLTISRADTEAEIYKSEKWRGFADPDLITMYEGTVLDCLFPTSGRYIIELRFDGEIVTQRVLDVFQEVARAMSRTDSNGPPVKPSDGIILADGSRLLRMSEDDPGTVVTRWPNCGPSDHAFPPKKDDVRRETGGEELTALVNAMTAHKRARGLQYLLWEDVLDVLHDMGYRKVAAPAESPTNGSATP